MDWKQRVIQSGFASLNNMLGPDTETGKFCHGDHLTMADCCLVPQVCPFLLLVDADTLNNLLLELITCLTQVWNALHRYKVDMSKYPAIKAIYERCIKEPAVQMAMPEEQPDYSKPVG